MGTSGGWSRRDWLKASVGALAGARASAGLAAAPAKTGSNIRLGITTQPYASLRVDEAARQMRDAGFRCVLCNYTFADASFDPLKPDWAAARKIVTTLERHDIEIVAIFGYTNLVDPEPARRRQGEARMETLVKNWKRLGSSNISTETGTLNPKSPWLESPDNVTEPAYHAVREALARLARMAEKSGAVISIEPYWRNIIDSVGRAARLFADVPSPALRLVMDPCNYFRAEDLPRMRPMIEEMFERLGEKIVVAHAKDVKASPRGTELPAAGLGVLDYPFYLARLAALGRPMDLLLEHLPLDDVPRAADFVRRHLANLS